MPAKSKFILLLLLLFTASLALADAQRGTVVRVESVYIAPDTTSAKLTDVDRGHEIIVLETSRDWLKVEAMMSEEKAITGWMMGKAVVQTSTPNGDRIVFGEAVDSEDQASQRHGRRGAAQDAMRLYYRVFDLWPTSPIAGESLYRAADIRWQIDKADVMSRPSAHERDPNLREGMIEDYMKQVTKKFPGTKWADLAAFHLLENKMCGDWEGSSKCPEKEAGIYEKYAAEHPQSPAAAEALYDAASRYAALIEIYKSENQPKKSDESRTKALAAAQKVTSQFPQGDWGARAQTLLYFIEQNVPTYGNGQ